MATKTDESAPPNSLWSANALPAPQTTAIEGAVVVDTAIVGAGFTGLRAALALAEAGQRAAVLEARCIGWGASGRTGGQVNPLPPFNGPDKIAKLVGPAVFERLIQAAFGSADELFAIIWKYGIDCQARQNGWLRVDHCRSARQKARRIAEAWNRHGAGIEFLDGAELHREIGSSAYQSGTLMHQGGAIHPLSYARGLARCAIAAGAAIHSDSPAVALAREGRKWKLRTPQGEVLADQVLLCTNGYTDRLWPGLAQSIIPLVSIQAASEPLATSTIDSILPQGRTISDTRREIVYGRREPDDRFLMGSLGRLTERGNLDAFNDLRRKVEDIYPSLRGVNWQYRWGGRIAVTRDHLPHLHEPEAGVFAGLGYNGRGVAMSNVMGRVLAERVLGKARDELPFPTSPIRTYPLHRFHEIGARALMWWMRARDRHEMSQG